MKLTVLGKYGPFPPENGATSGYLLETKNAAFVLDMGSGVFSRLEERMPPEEIDCLIISHFHHDHSSDVPIFGYYLQQLEKRGKFNRKIKVFCPESEREICSLLSSSKFFDVEYVDGGEREFNGVKLTFFKMKHPEQCYGVNIVADGKSFSYTGDTNVCASVDELYKRADVVLIDGGLIEADWNDNAPHLSVEKCVAYGNKWGNKSIISHINPLYNEEKIIENTGRKGEWTIAEEGKSYDL